MQKLLLVSAMAIVSMGTATTLKAQTNPSASTLPFSLTSQSSATLPAAVAVHRFTSIPTTRTVAPATGDLPNQGSSAGSGTGGWYHLGTDGIGMLSSGTNPAGAVVVAVNTTGYTNVQVSWICRTILNQSARDNSVALQYRIGTTGNFTDVGSTSTYSSTGNANGHVSGTFTEMLPAAANNQSVVQLRWIYWESVSTSGSRDKIAVDDIAINGTATASCDTPSLFTVTATGTSAASLAWRGVPGASGYQYALTTSAVAPGSGTAISDTTVTDTTLAASTTYYAYVRASCSGGVYSNWISRSFTTAADTVVVADSNFVFMTYNLLNYPGSGGTSRDSAFRTIVRAAHPDIMVVQELATGGFAAFRDQVMEIVDTGYTAGTFIDGPDSDNGIFFRNSLFQFISNTAHATDLRDINEFRLRHRASGDTLIIFSAHLKASNTASDEAQRADEIDVLRNRTNTFAAGKSFLVCGDFNIYGSSESAYQKMIQTGANVNGKFNDVISLSGTWNNASYAIHHTQSPRTTAFGGGATGGMDDRFDMVLFSDAIIQNGGFDVVSNSYKAYGNDGQHYNQALNTPPYTIYAATLTSALHDASDHIPVVVTLKRSASGARPAPAAISHVPVADAITLYPNPTSGSLYLNATNTTSPVQVNLYDLNGRILRQAVVEARQTIMLDLSSLAPGIYYLRCPEQGLCSKVVKY